MGGGVEEIDRAHGCQWEVGGGLLLVFAFYTSSPLSFVLINKCNFITTSNQISKYIYIYVVISSFYKNLS